jgi:hypothetical protein
MAQVGLSVGRVLLMAGLLMVGTTPLQLARRIDGSQAA